MVTDYNTIRPFATASEMVKDFYIILREKTYTVSENTKPGIPAQRNDSERVRQHFYYCLYNIMIK